MAATGNGRNGRERLRSWKEIASFFGTDERTVKRWEQRGLPVRRVPGGARATVYADVADLEAWFRGHSSEPEGETDAPPERPANRRLSTAILGGLVAIGLAGAAIYALDRPDGQQAGAKHHQPSQKAVNLYSAATAQAERFTPDSLRTAVQLYGQTIAEDPAFAEAYAGLAAAYVRLRQFAALPEAEAYPRARAAAERALELDPNLPHAHAAIGFISFYSDWDFQRGIHHFREVARLDPNDPTGRYQYGMALLHAGDFARALEEIEAAQRLDPRSRGTLADKGFILYLLGRRREGVALIQQVAQNDPDYLMPHHYLTVIHFADGNFPAGLDRVRTVARLRQDADRIALVETVSRAFETGGRQAMLGAMLAGQRRLHAQGRESAYVLAETYALMGDRPAALEHLRRSIAAREPLALTMRFDPLLRGLHATPEYRRLAAQLGIPR